MKLKFFLFIILLVNLFFLPIVRAENNASKTKELTRLQKKIKQISQKINDLHSKKNFLHSELKKIETQYGIARDDLKQIEAQIGIQNNTLKKNQQQIQVKLKRIGSQKEALESQAKAAYAMGRNEKLKLILNQQDPSRSGRMMIYYDYLNETRLDKIEKIEIDLQQLRDLKAERLKQTALLKEKVEQRKQENVVLLKTKAERKVLLEKIKKQYLTKKRQLHRYKISEKRLKSLVLSLQQAMDDFPMQEGSVKEFAKLKGKLAWPVKGTIIKKFGVQRSVSAWDGVLIKAREGAEIRAITRGRVVYADWLRGYGLLTIIEHGKGYMTLYAFNQSLYKTIGDWVEAGTVIATVGQSGGQSDVGLYFGIRKKGKPVDPVKWCRKVRHGKVG